MDNGFLEHLEKQLSDNIKSVAPVSGGDISEAYKLKTKDAVYFLKVNNKPNALQMLKAEQDGLQLIGATNTIAVPKIFACDTYNDSAFLLMEFIERKTPFKKDYEILGTALGALHRQTNATFGLHKNNFIGSLPQSNAMHHSWTDFYIKERLLPQLNLAQQKKLLSPGDCPSEQIVYDNLKELLQDVKPSLLHGDLWNGNFIVAKDGTPYLIDPAVYYGHWEIDIAMSKLFGGFDGAFYEAHAHTFKAAEATEDRLPLYQLYYLAVHLNMFGNIYYEPVKSILSHYF